MIKMHVRLREAHLLVLAACRSGISTIAVASGSNCDDEHLRRSKQLQEATRSVTCLSLEKGRKSEMETKKQPIPPVVSSRD